MAKGNMLLGMARGSVGDLTFARSNGQQVARARNRNPKNPRTMAQAVQRMVMATVSGARGLMREIVDHSFEGVKYGLDSLSLFSKLNMAQLRSVAIQDIEGGDELGNFQFKGSSLPQVNNYIVSRGSLPMTPTRFGRFDAAGVIIVNKNISTETWSALDYLESMNMRPGDQLTLLFVTADVQNFEQYGDALNVRNNFSWVRLVFTNDETVLGKSKFLGAPYKIDPKILDLNRSVGYQSLRIGEDVEIGDEFGNLCFGISEDPGVTEVRGAAAIISRPNSDGSWLRSTSYMHHAGDVLATAKDVYPSYLTQDATTFENNRILNNALGTASATAQIEHAADVDNTSIISNTSPAASFSMVQDAAGLLTFPSGISATGVSEADRTMRIKVPINADVMGLNVRMSTGAKAGILHTSRIGTEYFVTFKIDPEATGDVGTMTFTASNYSPAEIVLKVATAA